MSDSGQGDPVDRKQAIDLFKMYEDKGWAVKQQVMTIVSWLSPIIFGLIAFSVKDYCSASATQTTNLALATALALSVFLSVVIYGSFRHADRDYEKADKLLEMAKDSPQALYGIMRVGQPKPAFYRLGLSRIGGVHIFIMYLSFLLVALSVALLTPPRPLLRTLCPGATRAATPLDVGMVATLPKIGTLHVAATLNYGDTLHITRILLAGA